MAHASSVWQIIRRRKGLIALGVMSGLALGAAYYLLSTPVFQANAQLLMLHKRLHAATGELLSVPSPDDISTQQALIQSPLVVERAIKKRGLREYRSLASERHELTDAVIRRLSVTGSRDPGGRAGQMLTVSFRASIPEEATGALHAVIEAYQEVLAESDHTVELLDRARSVLHNELAQKESAYRDFRQKAPPFWVGKEGIRPLTERLGTIESRRTALLLRRAEIQGQLTAIETALTDGTSREVLLALTAERPARAEAPGAAGAAEPSAVPAQLLELVLEERRLSERFGPKHPEVEQARKRVELAQALLTRPVSSWDWLGGTIDRNAGGRGTDPVQWRVAYLKEELRHLEIAERHLNTLYEEAHQSARALSSREIEDEMLRGEIARTQQLYESIVKRLQDAGLAQEFGGYQARVIAPPGSGGVVRIKPDLFFVVGVAALGSILLASGLVWLGELRDRGFRGPQEIAEALGVPVVGQIPWYPPVRGASSTAQSGRSVPDGMLCSCHRPGSAEAEAFRGMRLVLESAARRGGCRVVQVTSPRSGDGTTTVVANLAVSWASSGKGVLVDANFRRPRLASLFGLSAELGLPEVLADRALLPKALQPTGVQGLDLLACAPSESGDLLTTARFRQVIDGLRERYEFVLIDSPALGAATDALGIAIHADEVLLNLRVSRNARGDAYYAKHVLQSVGASIVGVVVNRVGPGGVYCDYRVDSLGPGPALTRARVADGRSAPDRQPDERDGKGRNGVARAEDGVETSRAPASAKEVGSAASAG